MGHQEGSQLDIQELHSDIEDMHPVRQTGNIEYAITDKLLNFVHTTCLLSVLQVQSIVPGPSFQKKLGSMKTLSAQTRPVELNISHLISIRLT